MSYEKPYLHGAISGVCLKMIEFENDILRLEFIESNIWFANYKISKLDEDSAQEALAFRMEKTENKDIRLLADVSNIKAVSKGARDFMGSLEAYKGIQGSALITTSAVALMLGNFYLRFSTQPKPTRLVRTHQEGLEWLRSLNGD